MLKFKAAICGLGTGGMDAKFSKKGKFGRPRNSRNFGHARMYYTHIFESS